MKEIHELDLPDDIRYGEEHEWARVKGDKVIVGISDYAQDQLGEIVFIQLPDENGTLDKGQPYGVVESSKSVSDLYAPVSGEVITVNRSLEESPELINEGPYGVGWLLEVKPKDLSELESLMTSDAYLEMLKGLEG
jgi:glycine cleavage system H protein